MLNALSFLFIATGLISGYWFILRPILRQRAASRDAVEALEFGFLDRLSAYVYGLKTRLAAWAVILPSMLVSAHDFLLPLVSTVDVSPLTAAVPQWAWPLVLIGVGALFRWLRSITTGPEANE